MLTLVDPLLVIIAVTICVAGIMKRSRLWMMGQPGDDLDQTGSRIKTLIVDGILHGRILRDAFPGIMHLLIFLAFLAPVAAIALSQFMVVFPSALSGIISIILDLIGAAGLIGVALAAYRRYIQKPDRLSDTKKCPKCAVPRLSSRSSNVCRFILVLHGISGWPGLERGTSETPGFPSLRSVQPRPPCNR